MQAATASPPRSRGRLAPAAAALLFGAFVIYGCVRLPVLDYNYDEGVYIQQARLVREGQRPYVDFFYHQTPLYLYTLAAMTAPAPTSLFAQRLPSLLASAATGLVVLAVARTLLPAGAAVAAMLLFYTAPLQFYGLLALPNALMVLLSSAGLALLGFRRGAASAALGAVLLVLAVFVKPLAIPVVLAAGLPLLFARARWRDAATALGAGAVAGLVAFAVVQDESNGRFGELLALQLGRFSTRGGFEVMRELPPFGGRVAKEGIETALAWNLSEHGRSFLLPGPLGCLHLLVLATAGQILVLRRAGPWVGHRLLLAAWWALPLFFSLVVWEPSWDHYFVQYLPPLAVLASVALYALWRAARLPRLARTLAAVVLGYAVVSGVTHAEARIADWSRVPRPSRPDEAWLTLDPFINFVSGSAPACGIVDPFNVYGPYSLITLTDDPSWRRFRVGPEELMACLEGDASIRLALGSGRLWFVDEALQARLDRLGRERVVEMPLDFRRDQPLILLGARSPGDGAAPGGPTAP